MNSSTQYRIVRYTPGFLVRWRAWLSCSSPVVAAFIFVVAPRVGFSVLADLGKVVFESFSLVSAVLWLFTFTVFSGCLLIAGKNAFLLSSRGIQFPPCYLLLLKFRLFRKWDSVRTISFGKPNFSIAFDDGVTINFPVHDQGAVNLYNEITLQAGKGPRPSSPTLQWEIDLDDHLRTISIIPLERGHLLKNGTLEIVNQIGIGGFSAVYLCRDTEGKLFTLKEAVPFADNDRVRKAAEIFDKEAKILARLSHPGIISLFDYFVEGGRQYLLFDYVDGWTLRQLVNSRGVQGEQLVLNWALKLAEILDFLHRQDPPIIHRDLTPDNVLLQENGDLILIDFGSANEFLRTCTGTVVGKPSYMAPEQLRGKAIPESDYYSLGATMYFALTGNDPEAISESHPLLLQSCLTCVCDDLVARLTKPSVEHRLCRASDVAAFIRSHQREGP